MKNHQFVYFTEARRHSQVQLTQENKEPIGKLHPNWRHWSYLKVLGFDR